MPRSTLERFFDWLRAERGASPHTLRAYEGDLGVLAAALGGRPIESATLLDLRSWLAKYEGAASSTQRRVAAVRTYFRWAMREGLVSESPAERLAAPRVKRPLPRVLAIPEADEVVEQPIGEGPREARNRAILEVAYGAGLRVSEVAGLNLADLDLSTGLARVRAGKGKKDRVCPMGEPAVDAVRAWLAVRGTAPGALFTNQEGGRLTTRALYDVVRDSAVKNGLAGVHPHALRHSYATHLLSGGADIRSIQEMMGHASLSTTQRYAQIDLDQLRATFRRSHPHGR